MKYPQIFENSSDPTKRYVFIEEEGTSHILGIYYDGEHEKKRVFKDEKDVRRKRSLFVSSSQWRLVKEMDRDTGLKLPIFMYPPWDTNVRWAVQYLESDGDTSSPGVHKVILSSFSNQSMPDEQPRTRYLKNMYEVKEQYDLLKQNGWVVAQQPEINIQYAEPEDEETRLTKMKEKELMERLMGKMEKMES